MASQCGHIRTLHEFCHIIHRFDCAGLSLCPCAPHTAKCIHQNWMLRLGISLVCLFLLDILSYMDESAVECEDLGFSECIGIVLFQHRDQHFVALFGLCTIYS